MKATRNYTREDEEARFLIHVWEQWRQVQSVRGKRVVRLKMIQRTIHDVIELCCTVVLVGWLTRDVHIRSCHPTTRIRLSGLRSHLTSLISMNLCLKEQICHALLHVCFRASFWDETRQIVTKSQILLLPATQKHHTSHAER